MILGSLASFLFRFNFIWLIQNIYFLENGISYTQLSIILGVRATSVILLEVPSGAFADKYGRKFSVVLWRISFIIAICWAFFLPTFRGFLAYAIFRGIADAMASWAEESRIFDFLKERGHEKYFERSISTILVFREMWLGIGVLTAGFITQLNMDYTMIGSIIIAGLSTLAIISIPWPIKPKTIQHQSLMSYISSAFNAIKKSKPIQRMLAFSLTTYLAYIVITEYIPITLKNLDLSYIRIGVYAVGEMFFFMWGTYLANHLKRDNMKKHIKKVYFTLSLLMSILLFFVSFSELRLVISLFSLLRAIRAFSEIVTTNDLQTNTESHHRATLSSFASLAKSGVYLPMSIIFGLLCDHLGLFSSFKYIAILPLVFVGFVLVRNLLFHTQRKI